MQYSDEYINSLLQELEKHYGKEFKERVLSLLNKQPQYIYFWELSGKTFGAIRCCFESRIVTRKEFLRYIISQDFNGKKEQAILHLGKISRDPLSKFLGKNVEILGVKAEYNYGVPLIKIDLRASRIKVIGNCKYTTPSHLKTNTNYYTVTGFIKDLVWKYAENADRDWVKIKIIDLNQESIIFCDETCTETLKESLRNLLGIELMKFPSKKEYKEYYTKILSEILYKPIQITTEKSMRCFQKEEIILSLKQNHENSEAPFKIHVEEVDSKRVVESCYGGLGIYKYGALGNVRKILSDSQGLYKVSIDFGGEVHELTFHPEGMENLEENAKVLIFYKDSYDLYASSRGDMAILTESGFHSLLKEFKNDVRLISHILKLPRAVILE
ncbi:MAG TPA: hypothetical protein ENI59_00895 [Euryarchaeota archaeon]|nr:hypothetical protein [Euryarchaeota archaeon]